MNKITQVLSIASFLGVIILLGINFSTQKNQTLTDNKQILVDSLDVEGLNTNLSISVIDIDSLKKNYSYYLDRMNEIQADQKKLINKQKQYQNTLASKEQALQQQVRTNMFKTQAAFDAATQKLQSEGMKMQEDLANSEKAIYEKDALYQKELVDEVTKVVNSYAEKNGIDYVVLSGSTSNVLYINQSFDITTSIVSILNDNYNVTNKVGK